VHRNNYPEPLPELLEGQEVYEVEMILKHQKRGRRYQYYVKWKAIPSQKLLGKKNQHSPMIET
jgi:hypothetical protein